MSKKIWILIIVVAIIGIIIAMKSGSSKITVSQNGELKGEYSLNDVIKTGKPYECTFLKTDGASNVTGHVTESGGQARMDLDIEVRAQDGGNFASHSIMKDGLVYIWTSIQPIGY